MDASKTKTVGITGATGYLGRHLVSHFLSQGYHVKGLTRKSLPDEDVTWVVGDIRETTTLLAFVQGCDFIIHTAAYVHRTPQSAEEIADCFAINRDATIALIDLCCQQPVAPFFLFVSTVAAIGDPTSHYGISKRAAEDHLHTLIGQNKLKGCTVRPCMIYGTDAPGNLQRIVKLAKIGFAPIFANGENRKSMLFIEHAVKAIDLCVAHSTVVNGEYLTLTDGKALTMREIVTTLCAALPNKPRVINIPLAPINYMLTCWDTLSRLSGGRLPRLKPTLTTYTGSAVFSADKFFKLLHFRPPYTTIDALTKAYAPLPLD